MNVSLKFIFSGNFLIRNWTIEHNTIDLWSLPGRWMLRPSAILWTSRATKSEFNKTDSSSRQLSPL